MFHCNVNLEMTKIIKAEMSSGPYFSEWRRICNSCNARRREEADFQMLWLSLRNRIHYPFKYFQQKLHRCQISEQKSSSLLSNKTRLTPLYVIILSNVMVIVERPDPYHFTTFPSNTFHRNWFYIYHHAFKFMLS